MIDSLHKYIRETVAKALQPQISINDLVSFWIALAALVVAIVALIYTVRTYLLKSGVKIRFTYTWSSGNESTDDYISEIIIENLKDRAVVIFSMHLRIGANIYLSIEDFEKNPLILKPFEAYKKDFDPPIFYESDRKRYLMGEMLQSRNIPKKLILSTTEGKYVVKAYIKAWNPVTLFFKNYSTLLLRPMRYLYEDGVCYGEKIKFLVILKFKDGNTQTMKIMPDDYKYKKYRNFQLEKQDIENVQTLKKFFNAQKRKGALRFKSFEIIEHNKQINAFYGLEKYEQKPIQPLNLFQYHLVGKIATYLEKLRIRRYNKRLKSRNLD